MNWTAVAAGLIPSIGVALVFWYAMRAIMRADRRERAAIAADEQERARADAEDVPDTSDGSTGS